MNGGRAVPLQRQPMLRARVALVGLKTPERIILGIVAHQPISAYFCQHRGRRNGKARSVGLHLGHHVCNVGRNKIPLAVDDRTCFSQVDTFTKLRKCTFRSQPLRSIHAQLIALCVRRRTNGPPRARCRNVIEHCFALCFRQLLRVARAAHQRAWVFRLDDVVREHRNANDKRPGPSAFAHLVYSHNVVMPSRQQPLLGCRGGQGCHGKNPANNVSPLVAVLDHVGSVAPASSAMLAPCTSHNNAGRSACQRTPYETA